jgi:hypothetical protein
MGRRSFNSRGCELVTGPDISEEQLLSNAAIQTSNTKRPNLNPVCAVLASYLLGACGSVAAVERLVRESKNNIDVTSGLGMNGDKPLFPCMTSC